jgi:hypothetical protein
MLLADGEMQVLPAPIAYRRQRTGKPTLGRGLQHYILALPGPAPCMGEAEEVERGALRCRVGLSIGSLEAEVDEASLGRMQSKSVSAKTLAQYIQNSLGAVEVFKRHDEIVGIPDKDTSPLEPWPHLSFEPFIQHMMQ